ncbi:hypothetical protein R3P38DRAFT_3242383 [Favolaschia claudopus]|uniref:C2H2-type domain-containing protein n=1 Tax=Favolaschia claudopus TaxID=2862362 RepID=A0AAV9Z4I8_9AGAR
MFMKQQGCLDLLAKMMVSTKRLREQSACNPGAGFAKSLDGFLDMDGPADAFTEHIESYIDSMVSDRAIMHSFDAACGRLYCPLGVAELLTVLGTGGKATLLPRVSHLGPWPFAVDCSHCREHELAEHLGQVHI